MGEKVMYIYIQNTKILEVNLFVNIEHSTTCDSRIYMNCINTVHVYSGITSGRVLDGELLYTKILEVNAICPVDWREISVKQSVGKCKQSNV